MSEMAQMMVGGIRRNHLSAMPPLGAQSRFPRIDRRFPYLPPTFPLPSPYLRRFMFGFRLKAKPEHEVELVLCWYGEGTELVRCWWYT